MVDYQSISTVLTGMGLIIALIYYGLQIRNQNRTRQAQLFMQFYNRYHDYFQVAGISTDIISDRLSGLENIKSATSPMRDSSSPWTATYHSMRG